MVVTRVREDVGEPSEGMRISWSSDTRATRAGKDLLRNQSGTKSNGESCSQDEPGAPGERYGADNSYTRHRNSAEEERRHAAENTARNGHNSGGELAKNPHDDEPHAASVTSFAVGAARQGDDTIVLSERGHWCYSA